MTITPEMVTAARAARELGCVSRTEGAMSMAVSDCIENAHFDTIDELSRQLRDALRGLYDEQHDLTKATKDKVAWQIAIIDAATVLALWPDDPTAEAR